ncbi:hypothetical protein BDN67DRAFT_1009362 [Paxillus ammoniavirescens]|nr:hypothetical protein BDN67DRAFT_1009362 [Paxillus ammoniavirescens]
MSSVLGLPVTPPNGDRLPAITRAEIYEALDPHRDNLTLRVPKSSRLLLATSSSAWIVPTGHWSTLSGSSPRAIITQGLMLHAATFTHSGNPFLTGGSSLPRNLPAAQFHLCPQPDSFLGKTSLTSEAVSDVEVKWIALKLCSRLPHVMSASDKPMGKKRALLIAVRHVRSNDKQGITNLVDLPWAHRDAKDLKDRLIVSHGYEAEDVILMLDDQAHPRHLWPTHKNILEQMGRLVRDALEDSQFFFYYSGHALQEQCPNDEEADKRDEEIVTADGKPILDDLLHIRLVRPLETVKGSKLFALFDCCHSETLLDLQQGNGPNTYSKEWKVGIDQAFKAEATAMVHFMRLSKNHCKPVRYCPPIPRQEDGDLSGTPTSDTEAVASIKVGEEAQNLSVICLSACRDNQIAHDDDERKMTFTKYFLDAIAGASNMSWEELRDKLKGGVEGVRAHYQEYNMKTGEEPSSLINWTQEPRYSTTPHTDLTEKVDF